MTLITFTWTVDGVATDAHSVEFGSSDGAYGLRRADTSEILIAHGTALDDVGDGAYEYELADPAPGLEYEYWLKIIGEDGDPPVYVHDFIIGSGTTKTLEFALVAAGAVQQLAAPPKLSSPNASYGVNRMDTGAEVVADGTNFVHSGSGKYAYSFTEPSEGLVYRYYVEAIYDGVTYWLPRTTAYVASAVLAIGRYTDSSLIEQKFGVDNVYKWLALDDGDEAVDFALRAYQFIANAEAEVDDLLRGGPCTVPFDDSVPSLISQVATALAANRMYEARGVVDMDPETGAVQHRLQHQMKWAEKQIARIKSGQLRLSVENITRHPMVLKD